MHFRSAVPAMALFAIAAAPAFSSAVRNPTGSSANTLAANDDESTTSAVAVGFTLNLFGDTVSDIFVNNNGNITFNNALSQFTPNGLASGVGQPIIAPYFADVDTRGAGSGLTTYGTGTITDAALGWNNAKDFAVEWPAVGYFDSSTDKLNTFELILVDRSDTGAGNFDIEFNYNTMQWETGDDSGGSDGLGGTSAVAGYSNGDSGPSNVFFQLPGSLVNGALIDGGADALNANSLNSNVAGRYDFQVRNGQVISATPEPGSIGLMLIGAAGVLIARRRRKAQ